MAMMMSAALGRALTTPQRQSEANMKLKPISSRALIVLMDLEIYKNGDCCEWNKRSCCLQGGHAWMRASCGFSHGFAFVSHLGACFLSCLHLYRTVPSAVIVRCMYRTSTVFVHNTHRRRRRGNTVPLRVRYSRSRASAALAL